jgi:hypothetical protein
MWVLPRNLAEGSEENHEKLIENQCPGRDFLLQRDLVRFAFVVIIRIL